VHKGVSHSTLTTAKSNVAASRNTLRSAFDLVTDTLLVAAAVAAIVAALVGGGILADRLPTWTFPAACIGVLVLGAMALLQMDGRR